MDTNNEIFKRIQEYKVDFMYSKYAYFAAAKRIKNRNQNVFENKKNLSILSIVLAILSLSGVAILFSQKFKNIAALGIGIFSIIAVVVDIFLLVEVKSENEYFYLKRAEDYSDLFKYIKNIEAKYKSGETTVKNLLDELNVISEKDSKLRANPLILETIDYKQAKDQIANGEQSYEKNETKA